MRSILDAGADLLFIIILDGAFLAAVVPRSSSSNLYFQHAHFIPIVGVGKGAHQLVHGDLQNGCTHYWNYLEGHWPCAGGLSAVNAIGTQLRDPINSGLTRWRMAV